MTVAKMLTNGHSSARNASDHSIASTNGANGTHSSALPVTLLSGFLGSGKTTLLKHVLKSEHGLKIAVVVNDIGAINVDAALIRNTHHVTKTEAKVIALQNGCICCTLRGDLLEELVRLADLKAFDYIIVESSGISEPEQVAEVFDTRLAEQLAAMGNEEGLQGLDESTLAVLKRVQDIGGLEKLARLDTTCTVIDAFTIFHDFETDELISSRRDDVTSEDERTVSDLLVDQIEFAEVVILNKIDMVDANARARIKKLIGKLNHRAKVVESTYGKIDVNKIVNTGLFNMELAQTGYGWLQDLHAMTLREIHGKKTVTPMPETEEYDVKNFVYVRRRPFHPRRLYEMIHDTFILQHDVEDMEEDNDDDEEMGDENVSNGTEDPSEEESDTEMDDAPAFPDNETILKNKKAHPLFSRLFRSKGEIWLATRPKRAGEWSQAGAMLTLSGGRNWFCVSDSSEYQTGIDEIDRMVKYDMEAGGECGDRRQELVFIGENLNIAGVEAAFDACLLTDDEWEKSKTQILIGDDTEGRLEELFADGFPSWAETSDNHDHHAHA